MSGQFIGRAVVEILAIARSRKLRLLVACQHLTQLSDDLRDSLLAITAIRAFFRLGYDDARIIAATLAAGTGEEVSVVEAVSQRKLDSKTKEMVGPMASVSHPICDAWGNELRLTDSVWQEFLLGRSSRSWEYSMKALTPLHADSDFNPFDPLPRLLELARLSRISRLYIHAADTGEPVELTRYVKGLHYSQYSMRGPAPLRLVIEFPKPRFSIAAKVTESERRERWTRLLMDLPTARAVVVLAPEAPLLTQVVAVPDPERPPGFERFLSTALVSSGQTIPDLKRVFQHRRDEVARLEEIGVEILGDQDEVRSTRSRGTRRAARAEQLTSRSERIPPPREPAELLVSIGEIDSDGSLA